MDPLTAALTGLLLGLSSGGQCFWSCASVMAPFLVSTESDLQQDAARWSSVPGLLRLLLWYNLGRLLAYLAVALVVVAFRAEAAALPAAAHACARLVIAALLGWSLLRPARRERCWRRSTRAGGAFALGALQGVSPCPPFLAAVGLALATPTAAGGLLLFLSLFVGTTIFTVPLALIEPIRRRGWLTWALRAIGALVCGYLVVSAISLLLGP